MTDMRGVMKVTMRVIDFPWLDEDLLEGKKIWKFSGFTYGVVQDGEVAISLDGPFSHPFISIPEKNVTWFKD